jgi:two-component system sensor histidine kinase ChiS
MISFMRKFSIGMTARSLIIIATLLGAIAAFAFVVVEAAHKTSATRNGVLDLTSWNTEEGIRSLDGEWEFYWHRFLSNGDFHNGTPPQPDWLAHVPEDWNSYEIDGSRIGESGFATYKLTVKVKEEGQRLALKFMPLSTSYRAYAGDKLLVSKGVAGTEPDSFVGNLQPATVDFTAPSKQFELIVHISNYGHAKGGMNHSIYLGTPEQILAFNNKLIAKDLFVLGNLAIAAFYSLSMFFMNREEKISLYFSLMCLVFIGRIVMTGSCFIYTILPDVSINLLTYLNYFTSHFGVFVFAMMIREFFPESFSNRIRRYFVVMTAIILAFITVTPPMVYSRLYIYSDVLCLVVLGYAFAAAARAVISKKPFAILAFSANSLCVLFVIIDFYYAATSNSGRASEFSTLGFFTFIFLYAFILARRFSRSFKEVRVLSRRLLELDKLKDEFLANTSHELRTPLQGIISIAESLLEGVEGQLTKGQVHNVNLIASSGRKLAHLIHDILDMSNLKHGEIVLDRKAVSIAPIAESILFVFQRMYPGKRIEWKLNIPQGIRPIYADENRLVQIFYNLIHNAVKFTDNGEVTVAAEDKEGMIEIRVADTGTGIQPDKLEVIFHAFEQADSSITRPYGGVGLGLSITKQLVELHGGWIGVESVHGQGSCFMVRLPAASGHEQAEEIRPASPYETSFANAADDWNGREPVAAVAQEGEHILVVDDDYAGLQSAVNLLKLEGYSVTAVMNGKSALQRLNERASDYRLVILDVMMPEMSGYEVCRAIRETRSFADLPVLMATAKHQTEDLVLGFEAGANDFIVKPFEPAEFKARVRTLMEWNQSMSQALKSEMAFLQAQIKPHFIYNTINTISYFCTRDGAKAKQLLNHFAQYLRSSFDFKITDKLIPLAKEIDIVITYLEIEKERFGDRLQVQLDVEDSALTAQVPPFILQPFVENAVLHGVLKKVEGGVVRVEAKRIGRDVEFRICDNGVGMTEKQVAALLSGSQESGVGLRNIQTRIKKLYGRELAVYSSEGNGTEVVFTLPTEAENHDHTSNHSR